MANCVICTRYAIICDLIDAIQVEAAGAEGGHLLGWRQFHLGHFRGPLQHPQGWEEGQLAVKHLVSEGNQNYYTLLTAPRKSPTNSSNKPQQQQRPLTAPKTTTINEYRKRVQSGSNCTAEYPVVCQISRVNFSLIAAYCMRER